MNQFTIDLKNIAPFVSEGELSSLTASMQQHLEKLHAKTGAGNDFLGWIDLPSRITPEEIADIQRTANELRNISEIIVVVGIGGSYLGAKAVIDALNNSFKSCLHTGTPEVIFAGQNICEDYHSDLLDLLDRRRYSVVVISKSGTTTEPAIAFRLLRQHIEAKVGKMHAAKRIVAITDEKKGALRKLAEQEGYKTFIIPDDVGGRYSVLTPVGLLPIAIAGFDIKALLTGAQQAETDTGLDKNASQNPACKYAAARNLLYKKGLKTEIMVNYTPKLHFLTEWWKQLYGESEGKEHKGIFTAGVDFTTDLHSLGQYIQEGERTLFETVLSVGRPRRHITIPADAGNLDQLNYISGKRLFEVNHIAQQATTLAHVDGGVPNIVLNFPEINEYWLGYLMYFFQKACAVSGYELGVNPFDQPGVEAYKINMFALLGKEGFETQGELLRKRID